MSFADGRYREAFAIGQWQSMWTGSPEIGEGDDFNLYAYVGNDPINLNDPFGLSACPPGDRSCIDDPNNKPDAQPDPVTEETKTIEEVVVTARKERQMTDGTRIDLGRTDEEQGFRVSMDGMYPRPITRKGTQRCDDGSERRAGALNVGGLGAGESAGHTHPQGASGNISGLPGPEDGLVAAATGNPAYVISSRVEENGTELSLSGVRVMS